MTGSASNGLEQPMHMLGDVRVDPAPFRIDLKAEKNKLRLKSLTILNAGHVPRQNHFRDNARFPNWAIVYIAEGAGTFQVNDGDKQPVKKGSFFAVYPGSCFHYGPGVDQYWEQYDFAFEGPRIREWVEQRWLEPGKVQHTAGNHIAKMRSIHRLMDSSAPSNSDRAAMLLESLLYDFVASTESVPPSENKSQMVARLLEGLSGCLYRPFDAKQLCEKHRISIPTLRRIVSKHTGYPLNDYLHRLKIAEAQTLLMNTHQPIKDIASALGYHDVYYFSRLFKKIVGFSPNIFRNIQGHRFPRE